MLNSITTYKFAQMQHAEYEAQVSKRSHNLEARNSEMGSNKGMILGKVATWLQQIREPFVEKRVRKLATSNQ